MSAWTEPIYNNSQVDAAGAFLAANDPTEVEDAWELGPAYSVVDNFRSAHAFPLNTIQMALRHRVSEVDATGVVAQRIKRLSSIEAKLRRFPRMRLSQMQDLGGCRAIVSSIGLVDSLRDAWKRSRARHELVGEKDYIREPSVSGYRGRHLVYAYKSDRSEIFNGLKLEIQLRTNLQHTWATAVETVGAFTGQALKSSRGTKSWLRFFALMSTEMAWKEGNSVPVPNTPSDRLELSEEIRRHVEELEVEKLLRAYAEAIKVTTSQMKNARYFLLDLDTSSADKSVNLSITGYPSTVLDSASQAYLKIEKDIAEGKRSGQAVLVSVGSFDALRRAYPNYYLDTQAFLNEVQQAISMS